MASINVQAVSDALKSNPTLLATVVVGLCITVSTIMGELKDSQKTDQEILRALALSNATQQQIATRLTSIEDASQKQFKLIRDLRTDVNKNDKQIMILQVNDQQMWSTINDIRTYVPTRIIEVESRVVALEKDVERIEGVTK